MSSLHIFSLSRVDVCHPAHKLSYTACCGIAHAMTEKNSRLLSHTHPDARARVRICIYLSGSVIFLKFVSVSFVHCPFAKVIWATVRSSRLCGSNTTTTMKGITIHSFHSMMCCVYSRTPTKEATNATFLSHFIPTAKLCMHTLFI